MCDQRMNWEIWSLSIMNGTHGRDLLRNIQSMVVIEFKPLLGLP